MINKIIWYGQNEIVLPKRIKKALFEIKGEHFICQILPKYGWIAGGAIRSRIANDGASDWDCYFQDVKQLNDAWCRLGKLAGTSLTNEDESVVTFNTCFGKVDLVKKYYTTMQDCLKEFDFRVCQFAMNNYGDFMMNEMALGDLTQRALVLDYVSCPASTLIRTQKYAAKGYSISLEENKKLVEMIGKADTQKTFNRLDSKNGSYYASKKLEIKDEDIPF